MIVFSDGSLSDFPFCMSILLTVATILELVF